MNNAILSVIMSGMINELAQAIDAAAHAMPESAERQKTELVYCVDKNGNEIEFLCWKQNRGVSA